MICLVNSVTVDINMLYAYKYYDTIAIALHTK